MRHLAIILTLTGLLASFSMKAQELRNYNVKDGIANSTVYSVMQDSRGFLWFCTETGVNRFDGHHFETFTVQDGLADNENFKSYEDSKGRIWFCSYNGRACYYKNGKFYNENNDSTLKYPAKGYLIFDLKEDESGNIWFSCTSNLVYKYDGKKISLPVDGLMFNGVLGSTSILFNDAGTLKTFYVRSHLEIKAVVLDSKKTIGFHKISIRKNISPVYSDLAKILPQRNICYTDSTLGTIYLTDSQLLIYKNDTVTRAFSVNELGFKDEIITFYYNANTLFLSTRDHGLFKIENFLKGQRRITCLLKDYVVTYIFKDNEGSLWLSTHNHGIFQKVNNAVDIENIIPPIATSGFPFYSIFKLPGTREIISGTPNGEVLFIDQNKKTSVYTPGKYQLLNRILALQLIDLNTLFVGADKGCFIFDLKTHKTIKSFPEVSSVKRIDRKGDLIAITNGHELNILRNAKISNILSFNKKFIAVKLINDSTFYYGATDGLFKYNFFSKKETLISTPALFKSNITDLILIDGYLFVGTNGSGIFIFSKDKLIKQLTLANTNLTSNFCQRLLYDNQGQIWVGTNEGISIFDKRTLRLNRNITTRDGLLSNDVKDIACNDSNAYIATSAGISIIPIHQPIYSVIPPRVYFTSVEYQDTSVVLPSHIRFKYFRGFFKISFTAITFLSAENIEYQYRFTEQSNWSQAKEQTLTLFDLEPGKHILQLRARKYNSDWSAPVLLQIEVLPLFWQTWWFKLCLGCIAVSIITFFIMRRISLFKEKEREKSRILKQVSELEGKALTNQMNPHFIFNSLNTVQEFILSKDERQALDFLSNFSVLMRQILNNSKKPTIPLREEIIFLEKYLLLEKTRFIDNFKYSINVAGDLLKDDLSLPPMLLQPVIENAVKYGINPDKSIVSEIIISICTIDNFIICTVEDFGKGIIEIGNSLPGYKKDSSALGIVTERLKYLSGQNGQAGEIIITDKSQTNKQQHGTLVTLKIPI